MAPDQDDTYSEAETVARRDAALRRALSTPHKPHEPIGKARRQPVVWEVGFVKAGQGHVARSGFAESPTFATPQEVYAWLAAEGLKPTDDPDRWIKAD